MNYSLLGMFVNLQTRNEKFSKLHFGVSSDNLPLRNYETQKQERGTLVKAADVGPSTSTSFTTQLLPMETLLKQV